MMQLGKLAELSWPDIYIIGAGVFGNLEQECGAQLPMLCMSVEQEMYIKLALNQWNPWIICKNSHETT